MGFAQGFSATSSAVMDAKRLKADKEARAQSREDRADEIKKQMDREERQQQFQKEQLAERIKADVSRDRQQRSYQLEDDLDKTIERSQDRSIRERLANAQVGAMDRQGQPEPARKPISPFEQKLAEYSAYEAADVDAQQGQVSAMEADDPGKYAAMKRRQEMIRKMNPMAQAAPPPEMGDVEMPFGDADASGVVSGKAKMKLPLAEIKAALGMAGAQQQPGAPAVGQAAQQPAKSPEQELADALGKLQAPAPQAAPAAPPPAKFAAPNEVQSWLGGAQQAPMSPGGGPGTAGMPLQPSTRDQSGDIEKALAWATKNPTDPRSQQIFKKYGSAR